MALLHFFFSEGNCGLWLGFHFQSFLVWAPLRLHAGLSAVLPSAGLQCCCTEGVLKNPSPLRFSLLLSGRYVEQCLPSPQRKVFCVSPWQELAHKRRYFWAFILDGFYTTWWIEKYLEMEEPKQMEAILSIFCASEVWKGLVLSEAEIWKDWQFTLVLSLEVRVFLWGVEL